jgi:L-ascorbate metabolism protein UlaG (beta-lactamase superfamily)
MRMRRRTRYLIVAVGVLAAIGVATVFVLSLPQFGGELTGERLVRARGNPHYRDGAFVNPLPPASYRFADAWDLFRGQFFGDEVRVPPRAIPVVTVDAAALKQVPAPRGLRAFWIGHASAYIEIDGARLLIDPIFSDYASPFEIGPKRFHPPPLPLADLPKIDAVLVTHDHYDHLDMRTIQALARGGAQFFVPLGIGAHLERWNVAREQIHEAEWWQEQAAAGVRIISTPSRHYSGRRLVDYNATLWTSWAVIGTQHRVYVSGDTGYSDHFSSIGARFGPFDMSFIKVGAYGPGASWLDIHMSAEDAVRAHRDVGGRRMFPVHWGTFNLAFHDWDEPIRRTVAAARATGVDVVTPRIGEIVDADQPFSSSAWWKPVR